MPYESAPKTACGAGAGRVGAPRGRRFFAQTDALVPVPLDRWRLFSRRHNQSSFLAKHVGAFSGKPVLADMLRRIRATPSQGHRKRKSFRKMSKARSP